MLITEKQKEFVEYLLKKNQITAELDYDKITPESLSFFIRQFKLKHGKSMMAPNVKTRYKEQSEYLKTIHEFVANHSK